MTRTRDTFDKFNVDTTELLARMDNFYQVAYTGTSLNVLFVKLLRVLLLATTNYDLPGTRCLSSIIPTGLINPVFAGLGLGYASPTYQHISYLGHRQNYLRTGKAKRTVHKLIYKIVITYTAQAEPWMARACRRFACAHDLSCLSLLCIRVLCLR